MLVDCVMLIMHMPFIFMELKLRKCLGALWIMKLIE